MFDINRLEKLSRTQVVDVSSTGCSRRFGRRRMCRHLHARRALDNNAQKGQDKNIECETSINI